MHVYLHPLGVGCYHTLTDCLLLCVILVGAWHSLLRWQWEVPHFGMNENASCFLQGMLLSHTLINSLPFTVGFGLFTRRSLSMAHHCWKAPSLLENHWKLKVLGSLVLLPKMDLFFSATTEKQWVFNRVTHKITLVVSFNYPSSWGSLAGQTPRTVCSRVWEV